MRVIDYANIDGRVETAHDTRDGLQEIHKKFRRKFSERKRNWIFTHKVFLVPFYLKKINAFESEANTIIDLFKQAVSHMEKHELLCEFNDLLKSYRSTFTSCMELYNPYPDENPDDLFLIFTYGGEV